MDRPRRTVLAGSISVATILLTAALAGAAGPAGGGGTSAASGGAAHAGGAAPAAAPAHASAPVATPAPSVAPSHSVSPSPSPAPNHATTPQPNPGNNTGNGDRRARWRHRDDHGNYTYSNGNFYSPYPYDGYINASPDGFYNGYYGYNSDFNDNYNDYYNNNGPPVLEPNSTANSAPAQPAPTPAPTPTGNTSAASAEAMAENSVNNNPQMIAANAAVHDAQQAFDTERRRVIQSLEQQSDYKAALAKRGAAQQQLNTARQGDAVPDPARLAPAAAAKMDAGDDVTRMQQQAIENDPAAKAAEQRLTEAVQRRDQLRAEISKKYQ